MLMKINPCDHVKHWLNYVIVTFFYLCFQWEVSTNGFTVICPPVCQFAVFPRKYSLDFSVFCRMLGVNNPSELMELYLLGKFPSNRIWKRAQK